jgi:radical SAM superfamily enzyme YgiQ (UPF0313 family)
MKIFLVGITGSSSDLQLAVFTLKSALLNSDLPVDVQIGHYDRIPPEEFENRCKGIVQDIINSQCDIVGFSVYTWNVRACNKIAEIIKQLNILVVFGGPEVTQNSIADITIIGEGELPFIECVRSVMENRTFHTPKIKELPFLDDIPSPYLMGYIPDELLSRSNFKAVIETQRGCNFRCAYCHYHANFPTIRYKNLDIVIAEAKYAQEHGASSLRFADGNYLSNKERATEILIRLKQEGVNLPLFFEVIPSFVNEVFANAIKEYGGVITVGIGLQTLTPEALRIIRRPTSILGVKRAYELLEKAGAIIITDIILGLPRETKDSFIATLEFMVNVMRHPKHVLAVSNLLVLPNTDMEAIAINENLSVSDNHFVYETPTMQRDDFIYCARLVAAMYRVLNSDMRELFYRVCGNDPMKLLNKVADNITATSDLEQYWLWEVYKEIYSFDLRNILESNGKN